MAGLNRLKALAPLLLLGGCVSAAADRAPPEAAPEPERTTYSVSGLESVLGRTARHLEGLFGRPQLDVREGNARKLQFAGPACVFDAYLYPPRGGGEPIVTHVDARTPRGDDFDRASCAAALVAARK